MALRVDARSYRAGVGTRPLGSPAGSISPVPLGGGPAAAVAAVAPSPGTLGTIGAVLRDLLSRLAQFVRGLFGPAPAPGEGQVPPGGQPPVPGSNPLPTPLPIGPLPGGPPAGSKPRPKPKPKPPVGTKPKPAPKPTPQPAPKPQPKPNPAPPAGSQPKPQPAPAERKGSGPLLRLGSSGEAVKALQKRLKELGIDPGPIDGKFGPLTLKAVKAFQRRERIEVDGIVGPQTWKYLGITVAKPKPPGNIGSGEALRKVTPAQLAEWGRNNKAAFFAALKPAAVEAEKKYGVPWQVTLAQAALESGWARSPIGGYNIFGIKGTGPAGSVSVPTKEWVNGRYVSVTARFAKYHDFYEAVEQHGKLFHNGYYNKALAGFKRDRSPVNFVKNIQGIYATSPTYSKNIISIMQQYDLI